MYTRKRKKNKIEKPACSVWCRWMLCLLTNVLMVGYMKTDWQSLMNLWNDLCTTCENLTTPKKIKRNCFVALLAIGLKYEVLISLFILLEAIKIFSFSIIWKYFMNVYNAVAQCCSKNVYLYACNEWIYIYKDKIVLLHLHSIKTSIYKPKLKTNNSFSAVKFFL